ncbi:MAG: cyclic nucleotide-binding domain-containing protein [Melioribacteraceae bacterium]|nr:cyclic nucleotide-binding domain-containing protein [Melioribacteraceae bacterium]MCF8264557.1 cyclic nucleotide-binding domain-containing protein [Melioribacteraceae bacterium]MCF8413751.1 cyclic nucleotide-binding domain-containing protein [Melioribacteraceae bacterium]
MDREISSSSFWANLFKSPTAKTDLENVLRSMPMFEGVRNKDLNNFMELIHNRAYQANEYIFHQSDPGIGLYIIKEGKVLITQTLEGEKNIDLVTFGKGDFFGELALIDDQVRSASAIALSETNLAVIFKPDLDDYIERNPVVGIKILRGMSVIITTRLRAINEDYLKLYFEKEEIKND